MQRSEQTQDHCARCDRVTLHQRTVDPVNHVLHLLVTLLCCGAWLPVWGVVTLAGPRRSPYRCAVCGQRRGELMAAPRPKGPGAVKRVVTVSRACRVGAGSAAAVIRRGWPRVQAAGRSAGRGAARLPAWYDRALVRLAGDGNEIVLWFLRVAIPGLLTAGLLFVAWWLIF